MIRLISLKSNREVKTMEYYYAEVARFDKNGKGEGRSWGFYVSPEKYSAFTVKAAKEI